MLYLLLLSLLSPLLPSLPLLRPPIWYRYQKFRTTACTDLLPFPLLLPLSCSCNAAVATRLLQRGCCNTAAATRMLKRRWCFFGGGSGLIKHVAALAAVNNISAGEVRSSSPLLFAWNLKPWMRVCIFMPTSSDSISGVQLEIIRRAMGRFQPTHHSLVCTPPPLIKNSPSRRRLKFFGAPATPPPPMSLMIFAAADPYLISVGPCFLWPFYEFIIALLCRILYKDTS